MRDVFKLFTLKTPIAISINGDAVKTSILVLRSSGYALSKPNSHKQYEGLVHKFYAENGNENGFTRNEAPTVRINPTNVMGIADYAG